MVWFIGPREYPDQKGRKQRANGNAWKRNEEQRGDKRNEQTRYTHGDEARDGVRDCFGCGSDDEQGNVDRANDQGVDKKKGHKCEHLQPAKWLFHLS